MRTSPVVALVLLSPLAALSQEQDLKKSIGQCAAVDDFSDRLECFDSLARVVLDPSFVESPTPDQWTVEFAKDPLDDTTTIALSLMGSEKQAQLVVRCKQKRPDVLLSWRGRFIGATEPVVWTRLGLGKAERKRWSLSKDHKAAFLPGDSKPFIRQLLLVDRLVVQTDHFAKGTITDVFDVHRLKEVIDPLRNECRLE